jgi:hypothetical protein
MRLFVWLLVLLNVSLLAYFNRDVISPKPASADHSIQSEKLKVLSEKDLATMPKKGAASAANAATSLPNTTAQLSVQTATPPITLAATSCYKWGNFTKTNLPSAQVVLVRLGLQSVVNQEAVEQADKRFWVYYPPLKSAALAQQKAAEIKALGVDELFIVQDSQWRNAISFGLFQDEQLATSLLNELQAKGVKGVAKSLHNPGKSLTSLLIKSVSVDAAAELQKIKPEFVGTDLVSAACP